MTASRIVEFLDPDGGYVQAVPLDEDRCRVLCSNVAPKGAVLLKDPQLGWTEATQDLGGLTRVGPRDLVPWRKLRQSRALDLEDREPVRKSGSTEEGEAEGPQWVQGRLVRGPQGWTPGAAAGLQAFPLRNKRRRAIHFTLEQIRGAARREDGLT